MNTNVSTPLTDEIPGKAAADRETGAPPPDETSFSTREPGVSAPPEPTGTGCPNCGMQDDWGPTSWCPACGYHPALRRCIDVERETEVEEEPVSLQNAIPPWVWILSAGSLAILVMSIAVRLSLAADSGWRAWWAVVQLVAGETAALLAHLAAFLYSAGKDGSIGPFDMISKPITVWKPVCRDLPKQAWRLWTFGWGETAAFCALLIIGGISYDALFEDWGVRKRASANLSGAIVEQARKKESDKSMEEAMEEFAEKGTKNATPNLDEDEKKTEFAPEQADEEETLVTECLVIGYRTLDGESGEFTSLLLATAVGSKLQYVGIASAAGIPKEVRDEIQRRLPELESSHPFVPCRHSGIWLRPTLLCEVEFEGWTEQNMLKKPKFRELLADWKAR